MNIPDQENDSRMRALALHEAAAVGDRALCKELVLEGEDVNTRDELGWTPLMGALRHGHCSLAQELMHWGASASLCTLHGVTALTLAVFHGDKDLLQALYSQLTPEQSQPESEMALQVSCAQGLPRPARWLLTHTRARVNQPSHLTGLTPLMLAVISRNYPLIKLLLEFGADPSVASPLGHDVFHQAASSGDKHLLQLLCHTESPTSTTCCTITVTETPFERIDPKYTTNNIHLDITEDIVLKNSPGRPVFKNALRNKTDDEMNPMLSPSMGSVFLPSPKPRSSPLANSWDSHCTINSLISPRPLLFKFKSPSKSPNGTKKRKLSNKSSCSSWLKKRLTKRRTRSFEDSDDCIDFDMLKTNTFDFSQLLLGLGLDEFLPVFKEHELDIWTFLTLTNEDLESMGIQNVSSQERIFKSIELLRKTTL